MATHETIGEFQNAQESWQSYVERLQQYFVANDVRTAEKQRAVLLSAVGGQTYQLIRNLLTPTKPTEVTFAEIVDAVLQKHVQPRPSIIVERFNFHSRARRQGEDVSTYVAELRKLSEHCKFGTALNDMLWDRLVCGIVDQRIQRRLLAEPDLTFAKALELRRRQSETRRSWLKVRSLLIRSHGAPPPRGRAAKLQLWWYQAQTRAMPLQGQRLSPLRKKGTLGKGLPQPTARRERSTEKERQQEDATNTPCGRNYY